MARRASASLVLLVATALLAGCGGSEADSAEHPCVVPAAEMASIWDVPEMSAHPQNNGYECLYAADGELMVMLAVRSPQQFDAERARFEDQGVLLPPLKPTDGFDGGATVDPRYNSLNVRAGDQIVSVELVGAEPSDPDDQLALEKRIARAALEQLSSASA